MAWLWVGLGGAFGAMLRYAISLLLPVALGQFPWATWYANVIGCALAGVFLAASEKYALLQGDGRLLLLVGFLGGFTTFSSFGLESFNLWRHGYMGLALLYSLSSLLVGFSAVAILYFFCKQYIFIG